MVVDLMAVDFEALHAQAGLVCSCSAATIFALRDEFVNLLQSPVRCKGVEVAVEAYPNLETLIAEHRRGIGRLAAEVHAQLCWQRGGPPAKGWALYRNTEDDPQKSLNHACFSLQGKAFVQRWTVYSSLFVRDLTLRSAASFGSYNLTRLYFDELAFWLVEQMADVGMKSLLPMETGHALANSLSFLSAGIAALQPEFLVSDAAANRGQALASSAKRPASDHSRDETEGDDEDEEDEEDDSGDEEEELEEDAGYAFSLDSNLAAAAAAPFMTDANGVKQEAQG